MKLSATDIARLDYLLQCRFDKSISAEEYDEMQSLLYRPGGKEVLYHFLVRSGGEKMVNADPSAIEQSYEHLLQRRDARKAKIVLFRRLQVAAVFLLLFTGMALLYRNNRHKAATHPVNVVAHADIAPGYNKATLILADGKKILLDTAHNGMLAIDGNSQAIKQQDGRLAYNATGTGSNITYNLLDVPRGGQYQVVLPDGTKVWLNAASSLKYPTQFTGNSREVELKGEAYFEVAHVTQTGTRKRLPFYVNIVQASSTTRVEVLGTHFNIMAYEDEPALEASLLEGSINIIHGAQERKIVPGQQALINQTNGQFTVQETNMDEVVAWKEGKFLFHDTPIDAVMRQVARWYNVNIQYKGTTNDHLVGAISRNVPASQLIALLEAAGRVHFEVQGNTIVVIPENK